MEILLASKNPTKIAAVRAAVQEMYPLGFLIETHKIDSGVSAQPLGTQEIYRGARNRANRVLAMSKSAELALGLEGGMINIGGYHFDIGIVYALGRNGIVGMGISQGHIIPPHLAEAVLGGKELSEVVAEHYGTDTIRDRDCSAVITEGKLDAVEFYRQPTVLALQDFQRNARQPT